MCSAILKAVRPDLALHSTLARVVQLFLVGDKFLIAYLKIYNPSFYRRYDEVMTAVSARRIPRGIAR